MLSMKSYVLPFLFALTFTLPSCFIANDLFLEEEEPKLSLPLEVVVKDSVYRYIQSKKGINQKYLSYGYEPLKVIVPKEVKNKEMWESRKDVLGFDQEEVNNKIAYYDSIVKTKKLSRKISIEHTFSLRERGDSLLDLQSINFILSNQLEVIDFIPRYQINLDVEEEKAFAKFYYESPIIKAYTYSESQSLSKNFYSFFKDEWNVKKSNIERGAFLEHIVDVVKLVQSENEFDIQSVSQTLLVDYMKKNRSDIIGYEPIDFSPLYEINEDEKLEGYYFFHTFNFQNNDKTEPLSVYVKFNRFYEVEKIIETNESYQPIEKN